MNQLSAQNLSMRYGKNVILDSFSMDLGAGHTLAILGRSGSGKTTILKAINLITPPQSGSLDFQGQTYFKDGTTYCEPRELRTHVGMVFQSLNLFPNLTARNNIVLALRSAKKFSRSAAVSEVDQMSERLGIGYLLDRFPETLSGGEAQRVALARALVLKPEVLLLDEITSALDPATAIAVFKTLFWLREMMPMLSIVIVTHAVHFAVRFASQIAFLSEGKLIDLHPAQDFLKAAGEPATRHYLSDIENV